ncbi:MAG TPA: SRPBCC family protein [Nocardioides sp.]|uniref:SRPBCC family protein n=1 Tax=Nocardioides sp. TaxID=35761 RepID=UPI002D801735|nr:SRPBCC family protein [Nocardioides sp.]HET6653982.1 SRPBCC family protein [Nocardioides sp.]
MNRPTPLPISASVDVDAQPADVWAVVSDVSRMPEFSPELRWAFAVGAREPRIGMRLVGINRRGYAVWPTTSKVVRFEPDRAVAWHTRESGATWTYELEPTATGTRLTGRRDLAGFTLGTTLLAPVIGGAAGHDRELADGIRQTLLRIKAAVESARTADADPGVVR